MVVSIQQNGGNNTTKGGTKQQEGVTLQYNIKGDNTVKKVEQYKKRCYIMTKKGNNTTKRGNNISKRRNNTTKRGNTKWC